MRQPISRRTFLGAAAAVALVPAPAGASEDAVLSWINRHAGPLDDLRPLLRIAGGAAVVGLGESSHGSHDQYVLKHRVARFLVEKMGFRTIAWEESWGSGVAIDRYVTRGEGDPRQIARRAGFLLQNEAVVDMMEWMRAFNRGRYRHDQVRFLGADIIALRQILFDELKKYVSDVAPDRLAELHDQLYPLRIRDNPDWHTFWYIQRPESEKQELIAHARAVEALVRQLPDGRSSIDRDDAVQHAHAMLGFYDSYTEAGNRDDLRDRYVMEILLQWQRRTRHRVIYSGANAHTAARPRTTVSFPPDPPVERSLVGGRLRQLYGRRYVSLGLVFRSGQVIAGWHTGSPAPVDVPMPPPGFVDSRLGQARLPDYLLDLRADAPPSVRQWLDGPARTRVIGGAAYEAANDAAYHIGVDSWRAAFDAILHLHTTTPSRLLS